MERTKLHILPNQYLGIGLFFIAIIAFVNTLPAQLQQQFSFNNFDYIKNMPSQEVFCTTKDQLGFVWIGSTDGLYKLDATNTVQVFKKDQPAIKGGLGSSAIRALCSDSKNNLWIGTTTGGLTKYHQPTGEWTTYKTNPSDENSISNNDILSIIEDSKGRIWIGTEYGLNLFLPDTERFIQFLPDEKDTTALSNRAVISILEDHKQRLWVSMWAGGLNLLLPNEQDISESTFRRFNPSEDKVTQNIWRIYQDTQHRYWAASVGGGMFLMELPNEATNDRHQQNWIPTFTQFKNDKNNPNSLSNDMVFDIQEDAFGALWISTDNGLNRINVDMLADLNVANIFDHYFHDSNNPRAVNSERIYHIYEDDQNLLWFGGMNGISQYSWYGNQFENFLLFKNKGKEKILSIQADQDHIWIGTNDKGLIRVNKTNGTLTSYHFGLLENPIHSLYLSNKKELYAGTVKGIQKINTITFQQESYPIPEELIRKSAHFAVNNIFKDKQGRIWMGTIAGLFRLDEQTSTYKAYYHDPNNSNSISDNTVNDIYEDSRGDLWFASLNGLNKIDSYTEDKVLFKQYHKNQDDPNSIPSNKLIIIKEVNNQLFFGSRHGLFTYDPTQDNFIDLNTNFARYNIGSLEGSSDHQLWGSTSNNIFHYDIENQSFQFYDSYDDLGGATYLRNASTIDDQGNIYFASNTGVTRFSPSQIAKNRKPSPIVLTDIKIISPTRTHISSDIYSQSLDLNHDDYHLTLGFAIQNFISSNKNQYAYMLEGFEKEWTYTSTDLSATYTNLSHGEYIFRIKASNNDGIWNEEELQLKISKAPAFWETYWFRGGILLLGGLIVYLCIVAYTSSVRKRNKVLSKFNKDLNQEIVERKKVETELHKRDKFMDHLVKERTQQLEMKNEEVRSLLMKIQGRNDELEDIVEQRTKELKNYNEELKRSNYDLEQFAYIASHDLQAPLRTVKSFSELLGKSVKDRLTRRELDFLDFIGSGVSSMQELVDSLLTFSRVNARNGKMTVIDLNQKLAQVQLEISALIKESGTQIIIGDLPKSMIGDKIKIKQLFQNLITNAIKFTAPNTIPIVEIQHRETPSHWEFRVIDNGIGVDPDFQEKIFQLFQRLHTKEEYEGTGIGLALCKKIVEQHKGTIRIESEKGKGSCFIFTINKNLIVKENQRDMATFVS